VGYDIEVVSKIAGMIDCALTFTELEWSDVLTALQNGQADIAIGTGYKPDRAVWSYYSESYRKEIGGLLIRAGTAPKFAGASLDEIFRTGFIFGKTNDDTYDQEEDAVFDRYPTQVLGRVSEEQNIGRLLAGSIDGILIEVNVAGALVRKMDAGQKVEFHPLTFTAGDYRLQISKRTVAVGQVAQINEAIQQLKSDDWFARTVQKYGVN
jgi:polar amino acid transport system substrate-binding protein